MLPEKNNGTDVKFHRHDWERINGAENGIQRINGVLHKRCWAKKCHSILRLQCRLIGWRKWGFIRYEKNLSDWIKLQGIKHSSNAKLGANRQLRPNAKRIRQLILEQSNECIKTHTWKWPFLKVGLCHVSPLIRRIPRQKTIIFITRYPKLAQKHEPVNRRRCISPSKRGWNETYYWSVGRTWARWGNPCLWSARPSR